MALIFRNQKILFLGAHPDDIELGCGGLVSALSSTADVLCLTLSKNQKNGNNHHLLKEHLRSMAALGVTKEKATVLDFETRHFHRDRQEILDEFIRLDRDWIPDAVFVHSKADLHQDHQVVFHEAQRAFRRSSLYGYEVLRSSHCFAPDVFIEISEADVRKKVRALKNYQTYQSKNYFDEGVIRATLIRNGAMIGAPYAEGFDLIRMIGKLRETGDGQGRSFGKKRLKD